MRIFLPDRERFAAASALPAVPAKFHRWQRIGRELTAFGHFVAAKSDSVREPHCAREFVAAAAEAIAFGRPALVHAQ